MLQKVVLENLLFLDIETVPEVLNFHDLAQEKQKLWEQKSAYQRKDEISAEEYYERAGIWAEFGKIVCISVGFFHQNGSSKSFRVTSFYGDERTLLLDFKGLIENHFEASKFLLCAHNGKEFDFPYIARRMLILGIPLPSKLDLYGKKPWEVPHIDTLELWKFGDYKHYTSLKLLANVLGIASPKEDMDGSMVREVYYLQNNLKRIVDYCELDVITTAQVFLRLKGEQSLESNYIIKVERLT